MEEAPAVPGPSEEEAAQAAVEPGKEVLPQWNLTPRQKLAFAQQQMLQQQQAQPAQKKPTAVGTKPAPGTPQGARPKIPQGAGTPEETTALPEGPADELAALEQQLAQELEQVHAQAGKKRSTLRAASGIRHREHLMQQTAEISGEPHGLRQRMLYRLGLRAVDNYAEQLGEKLKHNIKTGSFKHFLLALWLGVTKDLLDLFDTALIETLVAKVIFFLIQVGLSAILTGILWGEGTYFKRKLIKKFFGRMIITFIVGAIPGLNIFPEYTIAILFMEQSSRKSVAKQKDALKALQEKVKKLRALERSGKEISVHQVAKIHSELDELSRIANE